MTGMGMFLLVAGLIVSVLPAGATGPAPWTPSDTQDQDFTINYTSLFYAFSNDTLEFYIKSIGNGTFSGTATLYKAGASGTTGATGTRVENRMLSTNASAGIEYPLNIDAAGTKNLSATAYYPGTVGEPPIITSWKNSKTGSDDLTLAINKGETVKFTIGADQPAAKWLWMLDGVALPNRTDALIYTFNNGGLHRIAVNGLNGNGNTQTITWSVTVREKERPGKKINILTWSPQVMDYAYVNDTASEITEYSITTNEPVEWGNWSVDGTPAVGMENGNTYSHTHVWDDGSTGFHTVTYRGGSTNSQVEFRWYVNVCEIGGDGGSIFDMMDEALEDHAIDIKIGMLEYQISENNNYGELVDQKVNTLYDEMAQRQNVSEALLMEFKAGNITVQEYAAALRKAQKEAKHNAKFAKKLAKIARAELHDEKLGMRLDNISYMEDRWGEKQAKYIKKEKNIPKGNEKVNVYIGNKEKDYGAD